MARGEVVPCAVVIDDQLSTASVEMPRTIFKRTRVREGEPVVISGRTDSTRVSSVLGESLKSCEIAMGPKLAIFLGIMEGAEVHVRSPAGIGEGGTSEVEDFTNVLGQSQDRLAPLLGKDLEHFSGMTVEQVLDHLVRHGRDYYGKYLVAAPNPDGVGIPTGELCEDPSLHVKVWDPEE